MSKTRKPFKETKFGKFIKEHDSELFEFIGKRWPNDRPIGNAVKIAFLLLSKLTDEKRHEASLIDED